MKHFELIIPANLVQVWYFGAGMELDTFHTMMIKICSTTLSLLYDYDVITCIHDMHRFQCLLPVTFTPID